jgi:hypothetical protein
MSWMVLTYFIVFENISLNHRNIFNKNISELWRVKLKGRQWWRRLLLCIWFVLILIHQVKISEILIYNDILNH